MKKVSLLFFLAASCLAGNSQSLDVKEPVKYLGTDPSSNSDYLTGFHDGQMRPAIGVHNIQVMRANRTYPDRSDGLGWTYNHGPNLAYWNQRFYLHYLSNPTGEHVAPGATFIATSADGMHWEKPRLAFPAYFTANEDATIEFHFMHQRMGFYVAPNGRLLTMGYYGPHTGYGIGRVVREICENNEFGPLYFIRVNDNWEGELAYPLYTESDDQGFVEACEAFLNDKVRRMQWWEEHRMAEDREEFFRVRWPEEKKMAGQAFCFYTLPDSTILGFFKARWVAASTDKGETWTEPVQCNTLKYAGAKIWGQRMDNGRYALVYNPTNSMARHPLSIATSDDGIHFNELLNVHVEVPPKRFWGHEKRPGPQYVRGIIEGNGNPPGDDMWVVYSVNKEDMWISRIPVSLEAEESGPVHDNFNEMPVGPLVNRWNVYAPRWCPVGIRQAPDKPENVLMISDRDPYDYAKAVRVFQGKEKNYLQFRLYIDAHPEILAMELVAANGARCIQTMIDTKGELLASDGGDSLTKVASPPSHAWITVDLHLDARKKCYSLQVDGKTVAEEFLFADEGQPERIIFRTGAYRLTDDVQKWKSGDKYTPGWDEAGADEYASEAIYYLKDFKAGIE